MAGLPLPSDNIETTSGSSGFSPRTSVQSIAYRFTANVPLMHSCRGKIVCSDEPFCLLRIWHHCHASFRRRVNTQHFANTNPYRLVTWGFLAWGCGGEGRPSHTFHGPALNLNDIDLPLFDVGGGGPAEAHVSPGVWSNDGQDWGPVRLKTTHPCTQSPFAA
jgi:hypothetical protein